MTAPNASKDTEAESLIYCLRESRMVPSLLKTVQASYKTKCVSTVQLGNCTIKHLFWRNKNILA